MKHLIATLALLGSSGIFAAAQTTSGTVHYLETISINAKLDGEAAQFASMFPKEQKAEHVLYFNPDASMFQPAVNEQKEPDPGAVKAQGFQVHMEVPQEKYYTNIHDGQSVELREFFGRKFLVSGASKKAGWKMTGRQKTILNYPCQEAIQYGDHDTMTVWFTTAIPVSTGPRGLSGLPGLILAAKQGAFSSLTATSVDAHVPAGVIVAPKGGKKVSDAEFKSIVEAKMKEMGATTGPGGGQVFIKVRQN